MPKKMGSPSAKEERVSQCQRSEGPPAPRKRGSPCAKEERVSQCKEARASRSPTEVEWKSRRSQLVAQHNPYEESNRSQTEAQ